MSPRAPRPVKTLRRLARGLGEGALFFWYVCRRFWHDHCFTAAAALAFNLLFAIIPVIAVGFAILGAFPQFHTVRTGLQSFIVAYLLPQAGEDFGRTVDDLLRNTQSLTEIGAVALVVTSIILLDAVESTLNHIWRQSQVRPLVARITMYWAILTLVPLLVGASMALSSIVLAGRLGSELGMLGGLGPIVWVTPFLLMLVAFMLGYIVIPYRRVQFGHALLGAAVAAFLFQVLRWAFEVYIEAFPTYRTLYGALSAVPIFLLWVWLVWSVVLFGAEMAASLPEWRRRPGAGTSKGSLPTRRLVACLLMLDLLYRARRRGGTVSTDALANCAAESLADSDRGAVQAILDRLWADKYIGRAEGGGWYLARDPAEIRIADLLHGLDLGFEAAGQAEFLRAPWRERAVAVLARAAQSERGALATTLEALFEPEASA